MYYLDDGVITVSSDIVVIVVTFTDCVGNCAFVEAAMVFDYRLMYSYTDAVRSQEDSE